MTEVSFLRPAEERVSDRGFLPEDAPTAGAAASLAHPQFPESDPSPVPRPLPKPWTYIYRSMAKAVS